MEYRNWVTGFKEPWSPHAGAIELFAPVVVLALE
jgi:hypothetical protein